jgi:hypothetical protein
MLVRPLSREVRLLGTIPPLVVLVAPSMLDRGEACISRLSRMVSRIVRDGEAERGEEKAELNMAADGLVSRLSEVVVDAGRLVVSGLAISSDVGNDVRDAVASERTESMETEAAECGVDDKAGAGENEVIKGEGVVGEEEGVEVEFVVAEEPFPFTRYFDGSGMPKADATGTRIAVMMRGGKMSVRGWSVKGQG